MSSIILIIIAAILNAFMDIIENENFRNSIFHEYNPLFWYKRESWKSAKKYFGWKFDAWHIAKSLMLASLILAIIFYKSILGLYDIFIFGLVWNLTFNIFYNKIFR